MNSHIEFELFNIKQEEDPLSISESQDMKCNIKTEAEECYKLPEHFDIKHEIEDGSHNLTSVKTASEVESTQGCLGNILENYEKKSQVEKSIEEDESYVTSCEPNIDKLQQDDCFVRAYNHIGELVNIVHDGCDNSDFQHDNSSNHTLSSDKQLNNNLNISIVEKGNVKKPVCLDEKTFSCKFCSKTFSRKYDHTRHIGTHTNEKPFSCNLCNKSFAVKSGLTRHKRTHTNDIPLCCNMCNRSFSVKSYLIQHLLIHTNEKPFKCNFCMSSFTRKSHLFEHKRIHTNDKPFTCGLCKTLFKTKSNLTRHVRKSHK